MKTGIMQPYFLPYIGYFQLIKAVDRYVIYDDVNYIKGGWINRNNILINGERKLFTLTLKEPSPNKLINQIEIGDNFKKFLKTIQLNYCKAPFYNDVMHLLEKIILYDDKQLANFIANSIKEICQYLKIDTEILISSQINKDYSLKNQAKVINICKSLEAVTYVNAIGGQKLYDAEEFEKHGICLKFLKTGDINYQQFSKDYVPYLSILDVLMFNSVDDVNDMLNNFELIENEKYKCR